MSCWQGSGSFSSISLACVWSHCREADNLGVFAVRMSSVQLQGEFITEQLTPAEETFTEFKGSLVNSEEKMDDQHLLLDFTRIPQIILHRIGRKHLIETIP